MSNRRPLSRERIGALIMLLLTLIYGSQIGEIQKLPVDQFEAMNARSMPIGLFVTGILGSLCLWILSPGQPSADTLVIPNPQPESRIGFTADPKVRNLLAAAGLLLWTLVFSWLLSVLGFPCAVSLFLMGGFGLLGERRPVVIIGVAVATALTLWLILRFGFGLYLAPGSFWSGYFLQSLVSAGV